MYLGYGTHLDARLPLVNVGSVNDPRYYGAEQIEILPGQTVRVKLNPAESTDMINWACRPPFANAASLSTIGREVLDHDANVLLVSCNRFKSQCL